MSNNHAPKKHGIKLTRRWRPHKSTALKKAEEKAMQRKAALWAAVKKKKEEIEKQLT